MRTEEEIQAEIDSLLAAMREQREGKTVRSTTGHDGSGASFHIPTLADLREDLRLLRADLARAKSGGSRNAPVRMVIRYD